MQDAEERVVYANDHFAKMLGYNDPAHTEQHVYAAAAMVVNVLVAVPSTLRHKKAGAIDRHIVLSLFPAMAIASSKPRPAIHQR